MLQVIFVDIYRAAVLKLNCVNNASWHVRKRKPLSVIDNSNYPCPLTASLQQVRCLADSYNVIVSKS